MLARFHGWHVYDSKVTPHVLGWGSHDILLNEAFEVIWQRLIQGMLFLLWIWRQINTMRIDWRIGNTWDGGTCMLLLSSRACKNPTVSVVVCLISLPILRLFISQSLFLWAVKVQMHVEICHLYFDWIIFLYCLWTCYAFAIIINK